VAVNAELFMQSWYFAPEPISIGWMRSCPGKGGPAAFGDLMKKPAYGHSWLCIALEFDDLMN